MTAERESGADQILDLPTLKPPVVMRSWGNNSGNNAYRGMAKEASAVRAFANDLQCGVVVCQRNKTPPLRAVHADSIRMIAL